MSAYDLPSYWLTRLLPTTHPSTEEELGQTLAALRQHVAELRTALSQLYAAHDELGAALHEMCESLAQVSAPLAATPCAHCGAWLPPPASRPELDAEALGTLGRLCERCYQRQETARDMEA